MKRGKIGNNCLGPDCKKTFGISKREMEEIYCLHIKGKKSHDSQAC